MFAAISCSVAMWKYALWNTRFISGATGFPVSTTARTIHGAIVKAAPAAPKRIRSRLPAPLPRNKKDRLPAALRRHEKHRAGHHEDAGEFDRIAESGEHPGG